MESLQKTSILSNLYGLRAGMSFVSIERKKLTRIEAEQESLLKEQDKRIDEWEVAVGRSSAAYQSKRNGLKHEEQLIAEAERQMQTSLSARIFAVVGVLLLYAAMIFIVITFFKMLAAIIQDGDPIAFLGIDLEKELTDPTIIFGIVKGIAIPVLALLSVIYGIKLLRKCPKIFGSLSERLSAPTRKAASEKKWASYREEMARLDEEFAAHKDEILSYYQKKHEALEDEYCLVLTPIAAFLNALEQTYGRFLDIRDWRYIDLIIFYFETGRADNMKEALQQVDHQVQTDMIVQAITRAATELRGIILYAAERVGQAVREGWQKISEQVATQNAKMAELVSEQKMANALRECAAKDSIKLMEDVSYIRANMKR